MISWKGNLVPSLSTIVSLSVLNNVELCYRGTGTSWSRGGGSVIAAFFLAHNYVSEQFGNYVEYGTCLRNFRLGNERSKRRNCACCCGRQL